MTDMLKLFKKKKRKKEDRKLDDKRLHPDLMDRIPVAPTVVCEVYGYIWTHAYE